MAAHVPPRSMPKTTSEGWCQLSWTRLALTNTAKQAGAWLGLELGLGLGLGLGL